MKPIFFGLHLLLFWSAPGLTQDTLYLDLNAVLSMAVDQAIDLKIARSEAVEQDYAFQNARLAFQPQLFLQTTLPRLNRSIESRPLPDGTDAFVNRSTMYNQLGLSLNYPVEKWGGTLSLNSDFERLDVLKTKQFDHKGTYFISPINISYSQPLFSFNELKWQKERLSLLYIEFKERYARIREDIILEALEHYRQVFLAQQNLELAREKIAEADTLLTIKQRLFDLGQSTRAEILRLQLDLQQNLDTRDEMIYQWESAQNAMADFLGTDRVQTICLSDPPALDEVEVTLDQAIELAMNNAFVTTNFERRLADAESDLERAAKDRDIQLDIGFSLGLNSTSESLNTLFNPLLDREIFNATLRMPITGWKRYEVRYKESEERQNQEILRIEKEKLQLSREAVDLIAYFNLLKQSLTTKETSYQTAEEILDLTQRQYLLGNVTHTEISATSRDREQALLAYYGTLIDLAQSYYEIRRLCMYDFVEDVPLSSKF